MPRWTIAAALLAGLVAGYLIPRRAPATASPAAPAAATVAPAVPPPPTIDATEPKKTPERTTTPAAGRREADPQLLAAHQETIAKLAAAERALADTQAKLTETEARVNAAQEQQQRALQAQAQERELREQLQAFQGQLANAQASLKARDVRVTELEALQQRSQRQGADATQRLQKVNELSTELDDIARRREAYLNSIIGRYREATELFRAISLRLDNPRDGSSPLSNDLSRIQAAIQHADEDLRQVRALNAQSARVQKELGARR